MRSELGELVKHGKIVQRATYQGIRYARAADMPFFSTFNQRTNYTKSKLCSICFRLYIKLLKAIPFILLVGLSGSAAMQSAKKNDDIDLFIITAPNRLWTARFIAIICAKLCGIHRRRKDKHINSKVCLNLFFDAHDGLSIPAHKRTFYVAHELLQMKPLINKHRIYGRFLEANKWVGKFFPNGKSKILNFSISNKSGQIDWFEKWARKLQLHFINKHKTTETVTDTQLWFFPDDFELKIRSRLHFLSNELL